MSPGGSSASNSAADPWPLGDDLPLLLGGLEAARLPEARAHCDALLLVGPSVHASLAPELERAREQAEAWSAAVGRETSFFLGEEGGCRAAGGCPPSSPPPPPPDILWLPVGGPKSDRRSLTLALGPALRFAAAHLSAAAAAGGRPRRLLIADADGASTCVCVAAAVLQAMFGVVGGDEEEENEEEQGLIGRRVALRADAARLIASGGPLQQAVTRESVRRWVAFAASRYPPARPHSMAIKATWAFMAAATGLGGRRGLPLQAAGGRVLEEKT